MCIRFGWVLHIVFRPGCTLLVLSAASDLDRWVPVRHKDRSNPQRWAVAYKRALARKRADERWCRRSNFCTWLSSRGRWRFIFINRRRCSSGFFGVLDVIFFDESSQMNDSFDRFLGVFCIPFSFSLNEIIQSRWSTIKSLQGENHAVHDQIYFSFRLFSFLKLELISDFLIYRLHSCNVSFQEWYVELRVDAVDATISRQLELTSLLFNCIQYLKGARILMLEFKDFSWSWYVYYSTRQNLRVDKFAPWYSCYDKVLANSLTVSGSLLILSSSRKM